MASLSDIGAVSLCCWGSHFSGMRGGVQLAFHPRKPGQLCCNLVAQVVGFGALLSTGRQQNLTPTQGKGI